MKIRFHRPFCFMVRKHQLAITIPKITNIESILLIILPMVYFMRYILNWDIRLASLLWFGVAGIMAFYILIKYPNVMQKLVIAFAIDIIAVIGLLVNKTHDLGYAGILFATQIWGAFLYCRKGSTKPLQIVGALIIIYLTYRVATAPKVLINSWQYGIILSDLVRQNAVSIFICEFLSYYLISQHNQNQKVDYTIFFIALVAAFICDGMGGILCISVYVIGVMLLDHRKDTIAVWKLLVLAITGLFVVIITGKLVALLQKVTDDNGRFYIWGNYIRCIDSGKDFIFGADVSTVPFLVTANNLHNTIMNWHYNYGIIPFVYFTWRVIGNCVYCLKNKRHTLLLVMGVTLLRSMTDEADFAFSGLWTYIWLERIFDSNNPKKRKRIAR